MMRHFVRCMSFFNVAFLFSTAVVKFTALVPNVQAADVTLDCPAPGTWVDGPTNITCTLDSTRFTSAVCAGLRLDNLRFLFQANGSSIEDNKCQVSAFEGSCNGNINADGCGCIQFANGLYTFSHNFTAEKRVHSGGSWTCKPTCFDVNLADALTTDVGAGCDPVVFYEPTAPPTPDHPCPDCERPLCPPEWVSAPIIFGLFRLFAILYFVLYVLFAADNSLWPFSGILAWWVISLMCLATAFFPECVVLCIIDAILWRPCCCLDCISVPWRITLLVLAVVICLASIIYLIVAGIVQLWPFPEISIEECPDFVCVHEGWQIFLFVVSCIGIAILICFLIAFLCERPPDRGLLVKCGSCHKWRRFTVTLDDDTLQNIFILETLNEIFKKCANHDQAEFNIERIRQKIREILRKRGMADIRNVKLNQTVCLKDNESNKWYLQEPGRALPEAAMKGGWKWHAGNGTYVDRGEMVEILQIRLYLLSEDGHEGAVEMGRVNNVSRAQ